MARRTVIFIYYLVLCGSLLLCYMCNPSVVYVVCVCGLNACVYKPETCRAENTQINIQLHQVGN